MTRGYRRRRGGRGGARQQGQARKVGHRTAAHGGEEEQNQQARRQGTRGPQALTRGSQPRVRRQLKMLPPDGIVLEELISEMQAEYGLPSTPQEYRLTIKVTEEAPAPAPSARKDRAHRARRVRLRRRRRLRSGAGPTDPTTEGARPPEPPE
ncbi:MAG: hypothetical protein ACRDIF_04380, partial [Actinomycetota bacterium]